MISRRGQSTLEWVVFMVIFLSVVILMRTYLVALVAGRWRAVADQFGYGRLYEPCGTDINGHKAEGCP